MAAAIVGKIAYHAGVSNAGLVLDASEKMIGLWCIATAAGAYVTINGGDQIPLVAGVPFAFALESRTEEWVGATIVFHATASYFVKSKLRA